MTQCEQVRCKQTEFLFYSQFFFSYILILSLDLFVDVCLVQLTIYLSFTSANEV